MYGILDENGDLVVPTVQGVRAHMGIGTEFASVTSVKAAVREAAESHRLMTVEELEAHMERRSRDRTETWTKLERMVRLATGKYGKE